MGYTLNALFLEIDGKYIFQKYFWNGIDAIALAESQNIVNGKRVTGYKIEEHKLPKSFDHSNLNSYLTIAEKYELLWSL